MENKYYTPELSEFFEGFEFQYQDIEHAQWISDIYKLNWEVEESGIYEYLDYGSVRVKYLDQQDIKDCGFGLKRRLLNTKKIHYRGILFGNENYNIMLYLDRSIKITTSYGDTLFQGIIKNKTELKKLLKQTKYE